MKNVPELRFKEFSGDWEEKKLDDNSNFFSGGTPSTSKREYYNGSIPFIKSGEIDKNCTEQFINEEAIKNSSAKIVNKGDLLFALYGANSGEVSVCKLNGAINQAVLSIDSKADNYFLYNYFLKNKEKIVSTYLQGGQGNLSAKIVKSLRFSFPQLEEQEKIANFLSKVDEKIAILEDKLQLWNSYKKGIMQQLFSQNLRFKDDDGNSYPDWEVKGLGQIADIGKGFTPSTNDSYNWGKGFNWLSIADMTKGKYLTGTSKSITEKGAKNRDMVPKNTLLMSFKLTIGKLAIITRKMYTNEAICNFQWKNSSINTEYAYYYLNSINILKYGSQAAKGITLNNDSLTTIPFQLPVISEQEKIATFLLDIDEKIQEIANELKIDKKFKKGLLQKMFC